MSRRKGELSPAAMDREWPHQVIVPSLGANLWTSRWPSICPRSHSVFIRGAEHRIYCFSDPRDAESFLAVFRDYGAERFDVRRRQSGPNWAQIKPA